VRSRTDTAVRRDLSTTASASAFGTIAWCRLCIRSPTRSLEQPCVLSGVLAAAPSHQGPNAKPRSSAPADITASTTVTARRPHERHTHPRPHKQTQWQATTDPRVRILRSPPLAPPARPAMADSRHYSPPPGSRYLKMEQYVSRSRLHMHTHTHTHARFLNLGEGELKGGIHAVTSEGARWGRGRRACAREDTLERKSNRGRQRHRGL
jgi:hypothetical protein